MPTPVTKHRIVAKTAAYQIQGHKDRSGTIFTNRGASAGVTFTLPPPGRCNGWEYTFFTIAAQVMTVATKTADTFILYNDATADSLATPGVIGTAMKFYCDGTSWFGYGATSIPGGSTGATYALATA